MAAQSKDWVEMLRAAVARSSRRKVAQQLSVSLSSVSMVLAGKYAGNGKRLRDRVLAQLQPSTQPTLQSEYPHLWQQLSALVQRVGAQAAAIKYGCGAKTLEHHLDGRSKVSHRLAVRLARVGFDAPETCTECGQVKPETPR